MPLCGLNIFLTKANTHCFCFTRDITPRSGLICHHTCILRFIKIWLVWTPVAIIAFTWLISQRPSPGVRVFAHYSFPGIFIINQADPDQSLVRTGSGQHTHVFFACNRRHISEKLSAVILSLCEVHSHVNIVELLGIRAAKPCEWMMNMNIF